MQFPVTIGLHRSRILDCLFGFSGVLCLAAILSYPGVWVVKLCLASLSLLLVVLAWRSLKPSISVIRLERNGDMAICLAGAAEFVPAYPETGATVHAWLTVIRLQMEEGRRATIIAAPDSLNPADFRRLRTFMRWQANFNALGDAA